MCKNAAVIIIFYVKVHITVEPVVLIYLFLITVKSEEPVFVSPDVQSVKRTRVRKARSPVAKQATPRGRKVSTRVRDVPDMSPHTTEVTVPKGRRGKPSKAEVKTEEIAAKKPTPKVQRTRRGKAASEDSTSPVKVRTPQKKVGIKKGRRGKTASEISVDESVSKQEEEEEKVINGPGRKNSTLTSPLVTKLSTKKEPSPKVVENISSAKKATTPRGRTKRGQPQMSPLKKLPTPKRTRRGRLSLIKASPGVKTVTTKEGKDKKQRGRQLVADDAKTVEGKESPKPAGRRARASVKKSPEVKTRKTSVKNAPKSRMTVKKAVVIHDSALTESSPQLKVSTPKGRTTRGKAVKKTPQKAAKIPIAKSATPKSRRGKLVSVSGSSPSTKEAGARSKRSHKQDTAAGEAVSLKASITKVDKTPKTAARSKRSQKQEPTSDISPVKTRTKRVAAGKSKSPAAKTSTKGLKRPADTLLEESAPKKGKTRGQSTQKTPVKSTTKKSPTKRKAVVSITPITLAADITSTDKEAKKPTRGRRTAKSQTPVKKPAKRVKKTSVTPVLKTKKVLKTSTPAKRVTRSRR